MKTLEKVALGVVAVVVTIALGGQFVAERTAEAVASCGGVESCIHHVQLVAAYEIWPISYFASLIFASLIVAAYVAVRLAIQVARGEWNKMTGPDSDE